VAVVRAYDRGVFISRVWRYRTGEHVSFLAPTGGGKTTLAQQLLAVTATPQRPAVALVMKPRDRTVTQFQRAQKWRRARSWPAPPTLAPARAGYVVWPRHTYDPDVDDPAHYQIFRRAILDAYKRGSRILFADEVYSLVHELSPGLRKELITVWSKGRSMGCGLWGATQRPRDVPLQMYGQAQHLFLAHDADKASRDRFGEIGGVDPKLVEGVTSQLPRFHWLYIRREDRTMCVVLS
jgi:energy-coupling factor transporter ATP-binding protein EcfA2